VFVIILIIFFCSINFFQFKKWQCIHHTKVAGKALNIKITNIYRKVDSSVVIFQTNRSNSQLKDNNIFDHENVRNLWKEIGGKHYPTESWDLDWDKNNYSLAYNAIQDFKRIRIKTDSLLYVDIIDFKNKYPIHSVDLSDQPQSISGVKSNIILHVDLTNLFQHQVELMKELFAILL
jgi:hypothetical protein